MRLAALVLSCLALRAGSLGGAEEAARAERPANRLAKEKSPYLLQHARNPVDWYPWGPEAFERARKEGKPIFLSIGYSTCHWCHVMERESFLNEKIAAYLNQHFVAIKVDREERPDIDQVYMAAVQAQTGGGGWPLSAFLTPEGKPFFTGTYFPPEDDPRRGRGFLSLCQRVQEVWSTNRAEVEEGADRLSQMLRAQAESVLAGAPLKAALLPKAFAAIAAEYDDEHGGFGHDRKFPRTTVLEFLLRYSLTRPAIKDGTAERARAMVTASLDAMIRGGIRDHLAGGFHRYTVDRVWLIPHFEKMLYDQALIARTLVDAHRATGNPVYLEVARETMDYVLERLRGPDGELYSAEDADTAGEEGKTYVWRRAEVIEVLGAERGERFAAAYGVTDEGNFEEGGKGACVLHLATLQGGADLAEDRRRLLAARDRRPQPFRDDKVLTEWNGFAIGALALLYQVAEDEKYLEAARRAARFVLERMTRDGKLLRRFRQGEAAVDAFLEDHAALGEGLLDLYEADFDPRWLEAAMRLARELLGRFRDAKTGTFFSSGQGHETLIAPTRDFYDGAVPSGNSVAFAFLVRLAELTGEAAFVDATRELEKAAAPLLERSPENHPKLLTAAAFVLGAPREVVIAGDPADPLTRSLLRTVRRRFLPALVITSVASQEAAEKLKSLIPLVEGKGPLGGKPAAFVCRGGACKLPARDVATLERQLGEE